MLRRGYPQDQVGQALNLSADDMRMAVQAVRERADDELWDGVDRGTSDDTGRSAAGGY